MKIIKIVLIVSIIFIVVLTIIALGVNFLAKKNKQATNTNQNSNQIVTNQNIVNNINQSNENNNVNFTGNENINNNLTNITEQTDTETYLRITAASFAERLGSYSNQSNYENISSLTIYMTASMQKWADSFTEQQRKDNPSDAEYYGITTKAVSTTTVALNENKGTAEFNVSTQRSERRGNSEEANVFYQDIIIKFVKEKDAWKVNEAKWQAVK